MSFVAGLASLLSSGSIGLLDGSCSDLRVAVRCVPTVFCVAVGVCAFGMDAAGAQDCRFFSDAWTPNFAIGVVLVLCMLAFLRLFANRRAVSKSRLVEIETSNAQVEFLDARGRKVAGRWDA
jgi:hypothetical protein